MNKIFKSSENLLNKRLTMGTYTTEDSVRYTFFLALKDHDTQPEHIILEDSHPKIDNALVDMSFPLANDKRPFFEFKYHRTPKDRKYKPWAKKCGQLFNDIYRQYRLSDDQNEAYIIYIYTDEVKQYLNKNGYKHIIEEPDVTIDDDFLQDRPKTMRECITLQQGQTCPEIHFKCEFKSELNQNHYLRIYKILA